MLKTTITVRNDEYMDLLPGTEQGGKVEMIISDQGSWNAALMMAQGNRPKEDSYAGLLVVAIAAREDGEHGVEEEIGPDYTGEDEDEREPGRGNRHGNSRPGDDAEGASQPSNLPRQSRSTGGEGAREAGDNAGDGGSDQDAGGDGGGDDDDGDGSDGDDDDFYSRPSK